MAERVAAAGARHPGECVRAVDREGVEAGGVTRGREDRQLATGHRLVLVADGIDGDRRRICGLSPIYALLRTLGRGAGSVKRYGQWPDPSGVVSFASVVLE